MKSETFYTAVNAQEGFEDGQKKELALLMMMPAFLAGVQLVLQRSELARKAISVTLPTPEKVLEIAHTQGRIVGAYEIIDGLLELTITEEDKKDAGPGTESEY